jgi:hypothetical protein
VALRRAGGVTPRQASPVWVSHTSRSHQRLARWRSGRRDQEPLRRPIQAVGVPELRDRPPEEDPARARRSEDRGHTPGGFPATREPPALGGSRREHDSKLADATACNFSTPVSDRRGCINPTSGVHVPSVRSMGYRIASPEEASDLIAALLRQDRTLLGDGGDVCRSTEGSLHIGPAATALIRGNQQGSLHVDAGGVVVVERTGTAAPGTMTVGSSSRAAWVGLSPETGKFALNLGR